MIKWSIPPAQIRPINEKAQIAIGQLLETNAQ
jgi:hypothetical protein